MKYFGKKSLSSVLYKVFFCLLIIGVLGVIISLLSTILYKHGLLNNEKITEGLIVDSISFNSSNLNKSMVLYVLEFIHSLVRCIILGIILLILKSFVNSNIFSIKNFNRFRLIGIILILNGVLKSIINWSNWKLVPLIDASFKSSIMAQVSFDFLGPYKFMNALESESLEMKLNLISDPQSIIIGLSILLFSHLFMLSLKMKEENDLTI